MSILRLSFFLGFLGASAFILPSIAQAAPGEARLVVEVRTPAEAGGVALLEVQGKDRSAEELQLVCKRQLESRPDLAVVFHVDARSAYETFYGALSACYNANVPAVRLEVAGKPALVLVFQMPPKPGTDGKPEGYRPEAYVRLFREGGRTVAYAFGHEKVEPGPALNAVVAEGLKTAGADKEDVTLVLRADREIPSGEVIATYVLCRETGAARVVFGRQW
jgi:biopolymer transport protein ExbD